MLEECILSLSKNITNVLNSCIEAMKTVLPMELSISSPSVISQPFIHQSLSVLIGIIGDERGRIIFDGNADTFTKIAEAMFGMRVEGEMLESFTGELGNMICGNLATFTAQKGITLDITPPTVIAGSTKIYGFSKGIKLPISLGDYGNLTILLMLEQK